MNFSQLIAQAEQSPEHILVPQNWGQGRAAFGGLVAALVFAAMRGKVPAGRPVRSLAVTFVGPLQPGVPAQVEAEVLREGKAVSQMLGRATQDGQVVALVQGSFGAPRESVLAVEALPAPVMSPPEHSQEMPYIKGVTPEFTQHLALRWAEGGMPFSNNPSRTMGGWVRLREELPQEHLDEAHLLGLVDAWPPALLPHLRQPAPGSSLTWTIEFMQPLVPLSGKDWCQYRAEIEHARDGYGHIAAGFWSPQGELLAISRQTVTVFA